MSAIALLLAILTLINGGRCYVHFGETILRHTAEIESGVEKTKSFDKGYEEFVKRGNFILATATARSNYMTNNDKPIQSDKWAECDVLCNGEPMSDQECTGRTEINCISDLWNSGMSIDVYRRTCEGKFSNRTVSDESVFDVSQACRGVNTLTMREANRKLGSNHDDWVTTYSYSQTCVTKFAMTVLTVKATGDQPEERHVANYCEGSSRTFSNNSPQPTTNAEDQLPKVDNSTVKCENVTIDWNSPCIGTFEGIEKRGDYITTFSCEGKWTPFKVNWECQGTYKYTRVSPEDSEYDRREQGCVGTKIIGAGTPQECDAYQMCNGEATFLEKYKSPIPIY